MDTLVTDKLPEILRLCRKHNVRKLSLFGSAAAEAFQKGTSDLDFLVEFEGMTPVRHAESYFGLMEDLQRLFGMSIDPVEPGPIRNPYFKKIVDETKVLLYAAA
ncbi:MAG: Nucleotidyltransferase domain protein [Syntrophaceae bacterium PtaB.Bin038]|nr:MAG: Nucleotidyltransferase domain protein [Syntrophaceae bacterium PtaB.Bin038]